MANGKIRFGKQSGGELALVFPDGVDNTEVLVPESGVLASVGGSVTDNAIARYDGTTGKLQDSGIVVDDNNETTYAGSIGNIVISPEGGGAGITFSRNGSNYISANGGINSELYFSTGHTGPYYENPKMILDKNGNLLLRSGTGGIGYGIGAGGAVTQLTSKSTGVTLNKPTGRIVMHNAALAAGATVSFRVSNTLCQSNDTISINQNLATSANYSIEIAGVSNGLFDVRVTNRSGGSLSESVNIVFNIIKGSNV